MARKTSEQIRSGFAANVASVDALVNFDRFILDFAIERVERLHQRLEPRYLNPDDNGEHTLMALKQVRANDALRPSYQQIFNQAVVLLVSYFGSTIADLFRTALRVVLRSATSAVCCLVETCGDDTFPVWRVRALTRACSRNLQSPRIATMFGWLSEARLRDENGRFGRRRV